MGRAPVSSRVSEGGLNKGPWTDDEDAILTNFIKANGEGNWRSLPKLAGLLRCRKSCRLRWMNYLRPDLKRGNFSTEEDELITKLHSLLGNRWSLIAGRIPGRTDNEIKNYWNSRLRRKLNAMVGAQVTATPLSFAALDSVSASASDSALEPSSSKSSLSTLPTTSTPSYTAPPNPIESSLFSDYLGTSGVPLFPEHPRFQLRSEAATPSETYNSDGTAPCLDDYSVYQSLESGYCSTWSTSFAAKEEHSVKHESSFAYSPESVLPQGLDSGDDFLFNDFMSFNNGLADLGDTSFQMLLQSMSMPMSPLHKNLVAMSWPADSFWS